MVYCRCAGSTAKEDDEGRRPRSTFGSHTRPPLCVLPGNNRTVPMCLGGAVANMCPPPPGRSAATADATVALRREREAEASSVTEQTAESVSSMHLERAFMAARNLALPQEPPGWGQGPVLQGSSGLTEATPPQELLLPNPPKAA